MTPNKSLPVTFDPPPIFAFEKTGIASNAGDKRPNSNFLKNFGHRLGPIWAQRRNSGIKKPSAKAGFLLTFQ